MQEVLSILDSAENWTSENKFQKFSNRGKGQGNKIDEKEIVAMLYTSQRANLCTHKWQKRSGGREEEIKYML